MNPKIERLQAERQKLSGKIVSYEARIKAIDEEIMSIENADIVSAVRAFGLTPDKLSEFLKTLKKNPLADEPNDSERMEDEHEEI